MAVDQTYGTKNYEVQGGDTWVVGGTLNIDGGVQQIAGANQPASVGIAVAQGAGANQCDVTFTVKDGAGVAIQRVFNLIVWLSAASSGAGVGGAPSVGFGAKAASGIALASLTANLALMVQTKADGTFVGTIEDAGKTLYYPCASVGGIVSAGAVLVAGNYK